MPLSLATHVHGADGLGDIGAASLAVSGAPTKESAADQLLRLGREHPGELDLLAVGPLTNLGLALRAEPDALGRYRSVVIMGGSGPEEPVEAHLMVDANATDDPHAADVVFAPRGARLVMVGVNVTGPVVLDEGSIARIAAADTPQARFASRILPFYTDFYSRQLSSRVASMHDPLAAGVLLDPTLVMGDLRAAVSVLKVERCWRAVAPRHPALGVQGRPRTRVFTEVDGRRFLERLLAGLVAPLPIRPGGEA